MDILTLLQTIVRRWLIVVPIVLITIYVAFVVGTGTEPEYEVDGTALLVSESGAPSAATEAAAVVTAPVFVETLRSREVSDRLAQVGATVPYAVEVDPATSIIRVTAASPDPAANVRTVEAVLDNLDEELRSLEEAAGVAGGNNAKVRLLLRPSDQPGVGLPSAIGSAFLVPSGVGTPNPYPPTGYTARILEEVMLGADARRQVLAQAGGIATFTVTQKARDPAPIVSINVLANDAAVAERTFQAVKATLDSVLEERQAAVGVEETARTRLNLLNAPAGAIETSGTLVKSVATVVGLGLIAAATAAVLVESVVASRAERRRRQLGDEKSDAVNGEGLLAASPPPAAGNGRALSDLEERLLRRR